MAAEPRSDAVTIEVRYDVPEWWDDAHMKMQRDRLVAHAQEALRRLNVTVTKKESS